jgi:hypothetical protein
MHPYLSYLTGAPFIASRLDRSATIPKTQER